ncbi:MAG: TetR/AcrR family transcriptional regulator [Thalassospira sp.]|uniref:TetR/AcrR family transcriptional regulator n=1 Tax=Thalassospira sp. TaxID=1912094 RepID=UPI0032F06F12
MEEQLQNSGWRGSADVWLNAAYEALLETGVDGVKIQSLAKRLNLSRTSFYWFFKDRKELLDALITQWRAKNTGNLIKQTEAYAETVTEAMLNVTDCWLRPELFDAKFEFAIRGWSVRSPALRKEIQIADEQRLDALKQMFIRFGQDERLADTRARTIYLVQIGYISMQTSEETSTRLQRIPQYVEVFTGQAPDQRELDRFFARHQQ